jgi:hypothetical protein
MAHERPKSKVRVNDFDVPPETESKRTGSSGGYYSEDYANMHNGYFARSTPRSGGGANIIQGPKGGTLEDLVAKLATLQYTVKGKVGEDGKFEIVFCSPEPIVTQVPTTVEKPGKGVSWTPRTPEVRYIEAPRKDKKSKRRHRTFF